MDLKKRILVGTVTLEPTNVDQFSAEALFHPQPVYVDLAIGPHSDPNILYPGDFKR